MLLPTGPVTRNRVTPRRFSSEVQIGIGPHEGFPSACEAVSWSVLGVGKWVLGAAPFAVGCGLGPGRFGWARGGGRLAGWSGGLCVFGAAPCAVGAGRRRGRRGLRRVIHVVLSVSGWSRRFCDDMAAWLVGRLGSGGGPNRRAAVNAVDHARHRGVIHRLRMPRHGRLWRHREAASAARVGAAASVCGVFCNRPRGSSRESRPAVRSITADAQRHASSPRHW